MGLLEASDVVAGYGDVEIIHGASVAVDSGELVCIIGPNGAGKSTLLKSIFGLVDVFDGDVLFDDTSIRGRDTSDITKMGVGFVPQTSNVFPNLTVYENLKMGAYILDDVPQSALDNVYDVFPILEERHDQRAGTMSGGQQQMLALGRALMVDPELLLVDEPSAGLAPDLVDEMFANLVQINGSGTAILMVEQNAKQALRVSDRGYVLDMGKNRMEGSGDELLYNDEVGELYLGGAAD
jgi:branched-chain amino acid transport system ATP-binding protein